MDTNEGMVRDSANRRREKKKKPFSDVGPPMGTEFVLRFHRPMVGKNPGSNTYLVSTQTLSVKLAFPDLIIVAEPCR